MSTSTSTQFLNQKTSKKPTSAVNNTVNKLILDRGSCKELNKKIKVCHIKINQNRSIDKVQHLGKERKQICKDSR